jgi:hypothetical protein
MIMRKEFPVVLIVACFASGAAIAVPPTSAPDLQCKFRHPIEEVNDITAVPVQVQNAMLARIDPAAREDAKFEWHHLMAPRGGDFNATDVKFVGNPMRRFTRAGHEGSEWFVWYERGGFVYSRNIALFHIRLGHANPIVRAFVSYRQEDPCALTDDLLDFKPVPSGKNTGSW